VQRAVNALEDTPLAAEARARLEAIRPKRPDLSAWQRVQHQALRLENEYFKITFNDRNATICSLIEVPQGLRWADELHPLGVLSYQSFSAADYDRFFRQYIIDAEKNGDWPKEDFCKPGLETAHPDSRVWKPLILECYERKIEPDLSVMFRLTFEKDCVQKYGAPAEVFLTYSLRASEPAIFIDLQWFNKAACRMPEALWFGFVPLLPEGAQWWMDKLGRRISPLSVVENGNRHLHAVDRSVELLYSGGRFNLEALDSPLVAPGQPSPLDFNNRQPEASRGMHFCLLNNLWGTNFPMWFEEDCRFRFAIRIDHP